MDSVFGLPAIKDSKALDGARQRNRVQQKMLSNRISELDTKFQSRALKILKDKKSTKEFLAKIQLTTYSTKVDETSVKRSSKSMSLLELDQKLTLLRKERLYDNMTKNKVEVPRARFERMRSRRDSTREHWVTSGASIVPWSSQSGMTLSKCKQVVNKMQKFNQTTLINKTPDFKVYGLIKKPHINIDISSGNYEHDFKIQLSGTTNKRHTVPRYNRIKLGSISRVKRLSVDELLNKWKTERRQYQHL